MGGAVDRVAVIRANFSSENNLSLVVLTEGLSVRLSESSRFQ
jgi:hypothetical protein